MDRRADRMKRNIFLALAAAFGLVRPKLAAAGVTPETVRDWILAQAPVGTVVHMRGDDRVPDRFGVAPR